ncbi:hypothetical protein Q6247_25145 [Klebsiella pneumoniae]
MLDVFRLIAHSYDCLAEEQDKYDNLLTVWLNQERIDSKFLLASFNCLAANRLVLINVCFNQIVAGTKATLRDLRAECEALLAEVSAIGGEFYIPPKLQGKVRLKKYVPVGSLQHLTGADHFFQEQLPVKLLTPPNANLNVLLTYQFWLGWCPW